MVLFVILLLMKLQRLIFVMGASGSGKTHALKAIEKESPSKYAICHFDSLGIPSEAEVREKWGGWDAWQKMRVDEWIHIILRDHLHKHVTVLDGQIRPNHIEEVCKQNGIEDYKVILLDCSDEERVKRLNKRGQPELVNNTLSPWAKFLREECGKRGYAIIDNTSLSEKEGKEALERELERTPL